MNAGGGKISQDRTKNNASIVYVRQLPVATATDFN